MKDCECYEEEVQPYPKTDYKPIIYITEDVESIPANYKCFVVVVIRLSVWSISV